MTFGNYCDSVPEKIVIKINDVELDRVESVRYLGLIFDYNMRWDNHIHSLINKTKYLIFVFAKLAKFMATKTMMMIYHALFHSILSYGIITWGGAYKNNRELVQRIQNRLLRTTSKNAFLIKY